MSELASHRSIGRLVASVVLGLSLVGGIAGPVAQAAPRATLSEWTGSVDLYRAGVFTVQKTWQWCTAADVQIIRNIVDGETDHARASQQRYFDYMRSKNRYDIPVADGVDPAGWTAGLRRFVDDRYRLTANRSFDAALRSSVRNLRRTNLPVGITVAHGNHAWILTGFSATADPAETTDFEVTSVRVVGPLWGRQNRTNSYDMRPNTELTPKQLKGFFTPWHYGGVRMAWEGRWVSIQPVPAKAAAAATAAPTTSPVHSPSSTASPSASPTASSTPLPTPAATPVATPSLDAEALAALRPPAEATDPPALDATSNSASKSFGLILLVAAALALAGGVAWRVSRR